MELQIGELIKQIAKKNNKPIADLAADIHTGKRNMYQILERNDMLISQLWKISESLKFNFFSELQPLPFGVTPEASNLDKQIDKKSIGKEFTISFDVKYKMADAENIGAFIKQVHLLGEKMGFTLV